MARILVIDDERSIRNTLKDILEYEKYEIDLAIDGLDGLEKMRLNNYDLVLCDIKMPGIDGLELLQTSRQEKPDAQFIMISGHGDIETAVDAIKKGAFDFIQKPIDLNRLLITVKNGIDRKGLIEETKVLRKKISRKYEMIGNSEPIHHVRSILERVAPTDARVLITGENGTGKEVIARLIHEMSPRNTQPFIEVNCAAIPSELIESELFGHEKGAFTSAIKQRKGKFEQADGGTLFLDEIGDMSLSAQAKVLRALQEKVITRVGSDTPIKVNVRVLAATNKILTDEISSQRFREDLYHRLSVILIHVPPLRERTNDIPLLINYFNEQIAEEQSMKMITFSDDAIEALCALKYSGNIRELRNIVERLMILCTDEVTAEDVKMYTINQL